MQSELVLDVLDVLAYLELTRTLVLFEPTDLAPPDSELQQRTVPGVPSRLTCSYHDVHAVLLHFEGTLVVS